MLIALLGVLKAGGAYVPLDPEHPPARTNLVLEDARPLVLLTQQEILDRGLLFDRAADEGRPAMRVVLLDTDWPRSRDTRLAPRRAMLTLMPWPM